MSHSSVTCHPPSSAVSHFKQRAFNSSSSSAQVATSNHEAPPRSEPTCDSCSAPHKTDARLPSPILVARTMLQSCLVSLFCLLVAQTAAQRRAWIPLRTEEGVWLSVREIAAGREYWLRPSPELASARRCLRCPGDNAWAVTVRFWREKDLETARVLLRNQSVCASADSCRVVPFQTARMAVRDLLGRWETVRPWLEVSGVIPATQKFALRPSFGSERSRKRTAFDSSR